MDNICAAFIYRMMSEIDFTVKKISKEGNINLTIRSDTCSFLFMFSFDILEVCIPAVICFMLSKICFLSFELALKMAGMCSPKCSNIVRTVRNIDLRIEWQPWETFCFHSYAYFDLAMTPVSRPATIFPTLATASRNVPYGTLL